MQNYETTSAELVREERGGEVVSKNGSLSDRLISHHTLVYYHHGRSLTWAVAPAHFACSILSMT